MFSFCSILVACQPGKESSGETSLDDTGYARASRFIDRAGKDVEFCHASPLPGEGGRKRIFGEGVLGARESQSAQAPETALLRPRLLFRSCRETVGRSGIRGLVLRTSGPGRLS